MCKKKIDLTSLGLSETRYQVKYLLAFNQSALASICDIYDFF